MADSRHRYSAEDRRELWRRWQEGESLTDIGRALDRKLSSIYEVLQASGGVAPRARKRSRLSLTLAEREEISRGLSSGQSLRSIARRVGRSPSTISREVARHGGRVSYRASAAEKRAWKNARRPQECKLASSPELCQLVAEKLEQRWSPEQVAGWLKDEYPQREDMRVSHETIYLTLFVQTRGALKRELIAHLRRVRSIRRPKTQKRGSAGQGQIIGAVPISERPAEAEDRAVPGHWEGDMIEGLRSTYVATLVERHSRYVMLVKIPSKDTVTVTRALEGKIQELPRNLMKTLTWDRGTEMADHARFTVATDVKVYFCDPQSPWQRGSNENTNGLLRQYLPKGTDLSKFTQEQLDEIANQLNTRPRKTLSFKTPAYTLEAALR